MALQALYAIDLTERWGEDPETFLFEKQQQSDSLPFARRVLEGTLANLKPIDQKIREVSNHWTPSRMNCVDRNILRIATFELLCCEDIPAKVSINEALELAKVYGTPETRRFLNGILDKIAKQSES